MCFSADDLFVRLWKCIAGGWRCMKCRSGRNTIPPALQSFWRTRYAGCSRADVVVGRSAHRKPFDGLQASNEVVCWQGEEDEATRLCERCSAARAIRASGRGRSSCRGIFSRREERARPYIPMLTPSRRSCAGHGHIARAFRTIGLGVVRRPTKRTRHRRSVRWRRRRASGGTRASGRDWFVGRRGGRANEGRSVG